MVVPATVPTELKAQFQEAYDALTKKSGRLFLFAGDQKIEHMTPINPDDLFVLAATQHAGAFATHLGLIARYGAQYPQMNYIVKLNGKTNLVQTPQQDPLSGELWSVAQVAEFKEISGLKICGVGYTIYLGSEFEAAMLSEAAQVVYEAHIHGLIAMLWIYPRGKAVKHEEDEKLIAGATSIAASLGADFVKIKAPRHNGSTDAQLLKLAIQAAGNTKVIVAGGERQEPANFLKEAHSFLAVPGCGGLAVGRNIYQHDFTTALHVSEAVASLVYQNVPLDRALNIAGF